MTWSPTAQEIYDKLFEMAYSWGDIEESLHKARADWQTHKPVKYVEDEPGLDHLLESEQWAAEEAGLALHVSRAFRVEADYEENEWGDPCVWYRLLFDVADREARESSNTLQRDPARTALGNVVGSHVVLWHTRDFLKIESASYSTPVVGEICRRAGEQHPPGVTPSLDDVPVEKPQSVVGLIEKDRYWLTPIEAPFYDALRETGLTFAVQPWIQGTDNNYRLDFLVFYDGQAFAVELDGHDYHKTRHQRSYDAARDRWFKERKIETVRFTGSQVFNDPHGCVSELYNVLRRSSARP